MAIQAVQLGRRKPKTTDWLKLTNIAWSGQPVQVGRHRNLKINEGTAAIETSGYNLPMARRKNRWQAGNIVHVTFNQSDHVPEAAFENNHCCEALIEYILRTAAVKECPIFAYCVMPDHTHLVIQFNSNPSSVMQSIKGGSANCLNKLLGRSGQFWQHKSYDVLITSKQQFIDSCWYVWRNPEKAEMVKSPGLYQYSNYREMHGKLSEIATRLFPDMPIS